MSLPLIMVMTVVGYLVIGICAFIIYIFLENWGGNESLKQKFLIGGLIVFGWMIIVFGFLVYDIRYDDMCFLKSIKQFTINMESEILKEIY